jgi:RNA polymerase sigma factor
MQSISINERVEKIRDDVEKINILIEEYKPFIASCAEKITGRYMRYGEDDELSIALMAFDEAIKAYDINKGNFLYFAQSVISRRLIDYFRKEKKHGNLLYLNDYYHENEEQKDTEKDFSTEASIEMFAMEEIGRYRRLEIEQLKKELLKWDITFFELAEASPKHSRTRNISANIIRFLLTREDLVRVIKEKKYVPVGEIQKALKIPRKRIERLRKYIIAAIIIHTGDYQYIRDYINI